MSDVQGAVLDAVVDAVTGRSGAATFFVALVVTSFLLGARVLATHRYVALGLRVAGLLTALTALVVGATSQGWVSRLDAATTSWFVAHRSVGLDVAATVISDFGSPVAIAFTCVISAALLSWLANSMVTGIVVVGTVGAAGVASTALKAVVDRPRPPLQMQVMLETGPSFPAGHVTGTAALLGMVALVVGIDRERAMRAWLAVAVGMTVTLVAASRVYLGVQWLSDVIAGAILAAAFVTIGAAVFDALVLGSAAETHQLQPGAKQSAPADDPQFGARIINPASAASRGKFMRLATPALRLRWPP